MMPGAHLSSPSFTTPPIPRLCAFKNILRLPLAVLPASASLGMAIALGSCWFSHSLILSGAGVQQRRRQRGSGDARTPCTDPSSLCSLPPGRTLTPLPSPFFLWSASLPWHDFPSWQGSRSLILHFLVPDILLSRSLLKTPAGKKVEGSSQSPGFLFQDWFLSRVWQSPSGEAWSSPLGNGGALS